MFSPQQQQQQQSGQQQPTMNEAQMQYAHEQQMLASQLNAQQQELQQRQMQHQMQQQQLFVQQQQQLQAQYQQQQQSPEQIAYEQQAAYHAQKELLRQQQLAAFERGLASMTSEEQLKERNAMTIRSQIESAPHDKSSYMQILSIMGSDPNPSQPRDIAFQHPTVSKEAVNWIERFNKNPDTWPILFQVLKEENKPEVLFQAATGIFSKLLESFEKEERALNPEQQAGMMQELLALVQAGLDTPGRFPKGVMSKLTECLSTLALQAPECGITLISTLFHAALECSRGSSVLTPHTRIFTHVMYRVVEELMEELEDETDTPVRAHLRSIKGDFQQFAARYITEAANVKRQAAAHQGAMSVQQTTYLEELEDDCAMLLRSLQCADLFTDMTEFVKLGLWKTICDLYVMMCTVESVHNDNDELSLFQQIRESIVACLIKTDEERSRTRWSERDQACQQTLTMVLEVTNRYEAARVRSQQCDVEIADTEELCSEIADLACAFAASEMEWLAGDRGSPAANAPFLAFWQFIVRLNQHPYQRYCVEATHHVIGELQRVHIASRPLIQEDFATQMTIGVLQSIRYPNTFSTWIPTLTMLEGYRADPVAFHFFAANAEWNDFLNVRFNAAEVLPPLIAVLGSTSFVQLVGGWILDKDATWQTIEAAIVLLNSGGKERFFELILQTMSSSNPDDRLLTPQQGQQMITTLVAVEQKLLAFKDKAAAGQCHPVLLAAICGFICQFHFLYEWTPAEHHGVRMQQQVTFLLACLLPTQMDPLSAKMEKKQYRWHLDIQALVPQDGVDMAGRTFVYLCKKPSTRQMLMQNPEMIKHLMQHVFQNPGVSEKIIPTMRTLWIEGFSVLIAGLVAREPVDAILGPKCESLQVAQALLVELATPALKKMTQIFNEIEGVKQQCAAQKQKFILSPAQSNQISSTIITQLVTLDSITRALAWGEDDIMEKSSSLNKRILAVEHEFLATAQARVAAGEQVQPLQIPPSLSFHLFSALHPLFEQCAGFFLNRTQRASDKLNEEQLKAHNKMVRERFNAHFDVLDWCVIIYDHCIGMLYPNELRACLVPVLHTVLKMYTSFPLYSVVKIIEKAVGKYGFGQHLEMRPIWTDLITKVVNQSMDHFKTQSLKDGDDLVTAFYVLAYDLYVYAPSALLQNPGLPLVSILKHAESMLRPENGQWCLQTLIFLEHVVRNRDPLLYLDAERRDFRNLWAAHGHSVLWQLILTTFGNAQRHYWKRDRPNEYSKNYFAIKMKKDRHGTALLDIFRESLKRWPKNTQRWYRGWKRQAISKEIIADLVDEPTDQQELRQGILTMMAIMHELAQIVKEHRIVKRLTEEEIVDDADQEDAMDDDANTGGTAQPTQAQIMTTTGHTEDANGMDA